MMVNPINSELEIKRERLSLLVEIAKLNNELRRLCAPEPAALFCRRYREAEVAGGLGPPVESEERVFNMPSKPCPTNDLPTTRE
jgi:hypothetical protein